MLILALQAQYWNVDNGMYNVGQTIVVSVMHVMMLAQCWSRVSIACRMDFFYSYNLCFRI